MPRDESDCNEKHNADETHTCAHCRSTETAKGTQSGPAQTGSKRGGGRGKGRGRGRGRFLGPRGHHKALMKGTHSLLDPRRQQHENISQMYVYTQTLEKALAELQRKISPDPHPLLAIASPPRSAASSHSPSSGSEVINEPVDEHYDEDEAFLAEALGVLSLRQHSNVEFHGPTATSEYFLKIARQKVESTQAVELQCNEREAGFRNVVINSPPSLLDDYPDILLMNVLFPCPPPGQAPPEMNRFLNLMPPYDRAQALLHSYIYGFSWFAMPVPNADLERIFATFYPHCTKTDTLILSDAHKLAVLFMVFLFGTLYDLGMDCISSSSGAEGYHLLARAALASDPITEHTTVHGVQAFLLIIWYYRLCPGKRSISYQWGLSGYLTKLVQAIGLHRNCRDPSLYIDDPVHHKHCEQIFWEYNSMDTWQSYTFGRPTSMAPSMIQCRPLLQVDSHPGFEPDFYPWKYSFARLVSNTIALTSATNVAYEDILKCESDLQQHYTPSSFKWPRRDAAYEVMGRSFQRCITALWQQLSIMYLHRTYFWEAISKHADDPSQSRYWHSVIMAYNSASAIVSHVRNLWLIHPMMTERMAPFWSHTHSAALVLGALILRSPGCKFSPDALQRFEETCDMFSKVKNRCFQPENAHVGLSRLKLKALRAIESFRAASGYTATDYSAATLLRDIQRPHLMTTYPVMRANPGSSAFHGNITTETFSHPDSIGRLFADVTSERPENDWDQQKERFS